MSSFDKFDATRTETVVVGMMMHDEICIWRDGSPSIWKVQSRTEYRELADTLPHGQIGSEAIRDGYYRTVAALDPVSMVAAFHTHLSLGRYGSKSSHAQFVQLSPLTSRRSAPTLRSQRHYVEEAIVAASEFSSRRGDLLVVSGYDVDGPALTAGTSFRDGQLLSILSAAPTPATKRWSSKNSERTMLIATLDPHSRYEVGELAGDALKSWGIEPWDVVLTFISPIELVSGSLIPIGLSERTQQSLTS